MSTWEPIAGETPIDPSFIKDKAIKTRAQLSVAQAENMRKAFVKYMSGRLTRTMARFDHAWFLRLHEEMFGQVLSCAGQQRQRNLNIGVAWGNVAQSLMQLAENLRAWDDIGDPPLLEQAVRLHHEAVRIHPFYDGNGRWSRMLSNIWLRLHKHPITEWPEVHIGEVSPAREEYIRAIRAADDGDFDSLIELHSKYTPST